MNKLARRSEFSNSGLGNTQSGASRRRRIPIPVDIISQVSGVEGTANFLSLGLSLEKVSSVAQALRPGVRDSIESYILIDTKAVGT